MDGFIRMPVLSVELKYAANSIEFGPKLKQYISNAFQEDQETYRNEISELDALRENACKAPSDISGCALLKKYFGQLTLLSKRFPMESGDSASIVFTWFDKYSDLSNTVSIDDIRFEMSCILHNIGAMHSYLGSIDTRLNSDGMKVSCTHFQCAAYAFQQLKTGGFTSSLFSTDFDPNIISWHVNLMLAQAQECILEKSIIDHRKHNIISKIAIQVSDFYKECLTNLENPTVEEIIDTTRLKLCKKFVGIKQKYYAAVANLFCAKQLEPSEEDPNHKDCGENIGERITYLQVAKDFVDQATKIAHKESQQIKEPIQFMETLISTKLSAAKKDNDFVYHEKIPSVDTLPELKGAILVKPVPFNPTDPDVCGRDIFQRLVPMSVHNASSLYSEEKAKMLRSVCETVDQKNAELEQFMAAMRIEELCLDSDYQYTPLPEHLLDKCAAFNAIPDAVPNLLTTMNKLAKLYKQVEVILSDFDQQLNEAQKDTLACQTAYGKNEDIEQLCSVLRELRDAYQRYADANSSATKSNTELHNVLVSHTDNLSMLSLPLGELKRSLPSPELKSEQKTELQRVLNKVEEMKEQRVMLIDQMRSSMLNDDITRNLLSVGEEKFEEVFTKELKKHEDTRAIINQNLAAQENILKALTDANAKCAMIRRETTEILKQREKKIESLVSTYDVYVDLKRKSGEGLGFYDKLQSSLVEFGAKMTKVGMQMNDVEEKMREKHRKTSVPTSVSIANEGPKLKDFMPYYREQKNNAASNMLHSNVSSNVPVPPANMADPRIQSFAPNVAPINFNYTAIQHQPVGPYRAPVAPTPVSYPTPVSSVAPSPQPVFARPNPPYWAPMVHSQQPAYAYNPGMAMTGAYPANTYYGAGPMQPPPVKQNVMDEPVVMTSLPPPLTPANQDQ